MTEKKRLPFAEAFFVFLCLFAIGIVILALLAGLYALLSDTLLK